MKSSEAVAIAQKQVRRNTSWSLRNFLIFPQALRDAIPREIRRDATVRWFSLQLTFSLSASFGGVDLGLRVLLNFRVEESGKLSGAFDVKTQLNLKAARAMSATLQESMARAEKSG